MLDTSVQVDTPIALLHTPGAGEGAPDLPARNSEGQHVCRHYSAHRVSRNGDALLREQRGRRGVCCLSAKPTGLPHRRTMARWGYGSPLLETRAYLDCENNAQDGDIVAAKESA
jgi:hypothetical protein